MKGVNVNEVKQAEVALENTVKTYSTENDPAQADSIHDITNDEVIECVRNGFNLNGLNLTRSQAINLIKRVAEDASFIIP